MNAMKQIREALGVTQGAFADAIDATAGAFYFYESGRSEPKPDTARKIIEFARSRGLLIDFNHVYGDAPLPELVPPKTAETSTAVAAGG